MRAEPAVFANLLNEVSLVLVQSFRVGIKGCEHELPVVTDERQEGSAASVPHHASWENGGLHFANPPNNDRCSSAAGRCDVPTKPVTQILIGPMGGGAAIRV